MKEFYNLIYSDEILTYLEKSLKLNKESYILSVGCDNIQSIEAWLKKGYEVYGIDTKEELLFLKQYFQNYPNFIPSFYKEFETMLPFCSVDLLLLDNERYLRKKSFLRECQHIIKNSGRIVLLKNTDILKLDTNSDNKSCEHFKWFLDSIESQTFKNNSNNLECQIMKVKK